jgi:hypothetical protein
MLIAEADRSMWGFRETEQIERPKAIPKGDLRTTE